MADVTACGSVASLMRKKTPQLPSFPSRTLFWRSNPPTPLQAEDISVSHRLRKPRNAGEDEPSPIIIRFVRRHDRDRVIKERKKLKLYNETRSIKTYINEDLTTRRAKLFAAVRSLQKRKLFKQACTYNSNTKVTMPNGEVKSINNAQDVHTLLPDANFVFHG